MQLEKEEIRLLYGISWIFIIQLLILGIYAVYLLSLTGTE